MKLTVIFRDERPMMIYNDPPTYRSVQIELTDEQVRALMPRHLGNINGRDVDEEISRSFIEPDETKD